MAKRHLLAHGTRSTPQSEPTSDDQVLNEAGGYVFAVDKWTMLRRFLILGTEGGSYYVDERKATLSNIKSLKACIAEDGIKTVDEIVAISDGGRAPKNTQALYALAVCFSLGDKATKLAAGQALPKVARIATHLYEFVSYAETMRGWGRMMRKAVSEWYARNPDQLAYQAIKYRQRDGWSHRDLLRLAHPKNAENAAIFNWIAHGMQEADGFTLDVKGGDLILAFEKAQAAKTPKETAELVRKYRLPREALNTDHLSDKLVWQALLEQKMPMTALIRNLANMTRIGVLDGTDEKQIVLDAIGSQDAIRKARIHPMALLVAQRTYAQGRGFRGTNTWSPLAWVTDALDEAFYLAFDNVEPTNKRLLLAVDVSGSMMSGQVAGSPLTPREGGVAMGLVTLHVEPNVDVVGYDTSIWTSGISRRQRLDDAMAGFPNTGQGTDCSLPMRYAIDKNKTYDAFVQYTDSQSWYGRREHPWQALQTYRQKTGLDARSVVVSMVANQYSTNDQNDAYSLDVVGFDTATPGLISEFISGNI